MGFVNVGEADSKVVEGGRIKSCTKKASGGEGRRL